MGFRNKFCSLGKSGYKFEKSDGKTFSFLIDLAKLNNYINNDIFITSKETFLNRIILPFGWYGASVTSTTKHVYKHFVIDWGDGHKYEIKNSRLDFMHLTSNSEPIINSFAYHKYDKQGIYKISIFSEDGVMPFLTSSEFILADLVGSFYYHWATHILPSIVAILNPILIQDSDDNYSYDPPQHIVYTDNLKGASIKSLPYNFLKNYGNFTELNQTFAETKISKISKNLLSPCTNLKTISKIFSNSRLRELPESLFDSCTNLITLRGPFESTPIKKIPDKFLDKNTQLESCSLCMNMLKLTEVPANLLKPLTKLKSVSSFFHSVYSLKIFPDNFFTSVIRDYSKCFGTGTGAYVQIFNSPPLSMFPKLDPLQIYNFSEAFAAIQKEPLGDPLIAPEIWTYFPDFNSFMNSCCITSISSQIASASNNNGTIDLSSPVSYKPFDNWTSLYRTNQGQEMIFFVDYSSYFYNFYFKNVLSPGVYQVGVNLYEGTAQNKKITIYWIDENNSETLIVSEFGNVSIDGSISCIKFTANRNIKGFKFTQKGTKNYSGKYDYYLPQYINIFKWSEEIPVLQNVLDCFKKQSSNYPDFSNYKDIPKHYFKDY